jgi:hypothetical protein
MTFSHFGSGRPAPSTAPSRHRRLKRQVDTRRVAHVLDADSHRWSCRAGPFPRNRKTDRPSAGPCHALRKRPACSRWSQASEPGEDLFRMRRRWSAFYCYAPGSGRGRPSSWRGSDWGVARCTPSETGSFAQRRTTSRTSFVVTPAVVARRALICYTSCRPRASRSASVVASRDPHATRLMATSPANADQKHHTTFVRS